MSDNTAAALREKLFNRRGLGSEYIMLTREETKTLEGLLDALVASEAKVEQLREDMLCKRKDGWCSPYEICSKVLPLAECEARCTELKAQLHQTAADAVLAHDEAIRLSGQLAAAEARIARDRNPWDEDA